MTFRGAAAVADKMNIIPKILFQDSWFPQNQGPVGLVLGESERKNTGTYLFTKLKLKQKKIMCWVQECGGGETALAE